jgi:Mg2+-importing ATPase
LAFTSLVIVAIGVSLPFTRIGEYLGFTALPAAYWAYLAPTLCCYLLLTQSVKVWLLRRRWI